MTPATVLFVDTCCPRPYDQTTLITEGMGGTEASVVRVAESLGALGFGIKVMQHNRQEAVSTGHATYAPLRDDLAEYDWHTVVVLRDPTIALAIKKRNPKLKVYLWMTDLAQEDFAYATEPLAENDISLITLSAWHRAQVVSVMKAYEPRRFPVVRIIPLPIDEDLRIEANTEIDIDKLVFFSSPHKGLDDTVQMFEKVKKVFPKMRLFVSNPGYYKLKEAYKQEGIVDVGVLPHRQSLNHVREALCVFYPNRVFAETFGLVYAEANAVGTPVLCHPYGAAGEVLSNPTVQMCDTVSPDAVIKKLKLWREGHRPVLLGKANYRMKHVTNMWRLCLRLNSKAEAA